MPDFVLEDLFKVDAEMIVIPISNIGSISESFFNGLRNIAVKTPPLKTTFELGYVKFEKAKFAGNLKWVAFVCTVKDYTSSYAAIREIGQILGEAAKKRGIKSMAAPILGTGAGNLSALASRNILIKSFYESAPSNIELIICTPSKEVYDSFAGTGLNMEILSSQLVLEAERKLIFSDETIFEIANADVFYYELARNKYLEFHNYVNDKYFYQRLLTDFTQSETTFQHFLHSTDHSTEAYHFLSLCGELVAYIDFNAYRKNYWNKYPDKRVLARSGVNQTNWIKNLLKIKISGNFLNIKATSIRNALLYLYDPGNNISMLSEHHRQHVSRKLLLQEYEGANFYSRLFDLFKAAGYIARNPENFPALVTRVLYLSHIRSMWLPDSYSEDDKISIELNRNESDIDKVYRLIDDCLKNQSPSLDLGFCGIRDLEAFPDLFECTHLEELVLSNEWSEYENGKWQKITSKNAPGTRNYLRHLPIGIVKLKNLRRLTCGGDWKDSGEDASRWGITSIKGIYYLPQLVYLNISNNELREIFSRFTHNRKLRIIHANNNHLEKIPLLSSLPDLEELYLSNNQITDLSFLKQVNSLQTLDLHSNQINDLSLLEPLIEKLGIINGKWQRDTISIANNPLSLPPMKIVTQGKEAVLSNFRDIRKRGQYINTDIKVILIGNSEVGKSTLVKYLDAEKELNTPHSLTHWMKEKTVKSKYVVSSIGTECDLHLFDFGGHDYYHDTHHLFYSNNTLYILLWDRDTDKLQTRSLRQQNENGVIIETITQDYPIKYWLESVKFFTREVEADNFDFKITKEGTYKSPLLLVQNKVSNHSLIKPKNNERLSVAYPFIYDFLNISIIRPKRNLEIFDHVFLELLNNMGIIGETLPSFYEIIKNEIKNYKGAPVLSMDKFLSFCNSHLTTDIDLKQCSILARYLEQIGILVLSTKGITPRVFMDKKWFIRNVHRILEGLNFYRGEFTLSYVTDALKEDADDDRNMIEIMTEFHMIFKHPYKESFIAPLYLPPIPPDSISLFLNKRIKPYRRIEYTGFIHKHIILSFFQKYGSLIKEDKSGNTYYYWKDALIIKDIATEELVMIKFNLGNEDGNAYIDVFNIHENESKVFILSVINFINEINKDYETEEMVTLDGKTFISLAVLNENAQNGKLVFTEARMAEKSNPKDKPEILFKLKDYDMFLKDNIKKKNVVISYSKKDLLQVHALRRYLEPLVTADLIEEPWYCTSLNPGDEWDLKIKEKFDKADIIFFMVSEHFFNTKYIQDYEVKNAIDRYDKDKSVKILPIILEFYEWTRKAPYNLGRFSALPYQAKPISDFKNPKMAWNTITASVRMMIEKDLDPAKIEIVARDLQEIYERQVSGKLDNNA